MWRPKEGWNNPYLKYCLRPSTNTDEVIGQYKQAAFEEGADAMLEALRKAGEHLNQEQAESLALPVRAGTYVLIPDED